MRLGFPRGGKIELLDRPCLPAHHLSVLFQFEWRSTLQLTRTKQLIKIINDWGSVLEAAQRLILQLLGMAALIYLVVHAILR